MAPGVDSVVVRTAFEDFLVRAVQGGAAPEGTELELARRVARELMLGLEAGDPNIVDAAQQLDTVLFGGRFAPRAPDASLGSEAFFKDLAARIKQELLAGRLLVEREVFQSLSARRDISLPELPPLPPARREANTQTFDVRFVDEVGKAISGVAAEFTADGPKTRTTNPAGIALLDGVQTSSASVAILDPAALEKVLDPRWKAFRPGLPPKESNTQAVVFRGTELGPFALKAEVPNTIVIKPPLGKLFVELWDKTGRVRHANRTYEISGPQAFEGTTDDAGRLLHEDVFPGDYQLSLALDFFQESDPDRSMDIVDSALVALSPSEGAPQLRMLGAVPRSVLARLDLFFNTNKTFLLPTALPAVRKLRRIYADNAPCKLLVVGHADTRGKPAFNDKLSLERAEATIAYLKDDVEAWFKLYTQEDAKKCWGKVEDRLMITAMPGFVDKPKGEDPVKWYQRTRDLEVDGVAGTDTRHALIQEYMSLDGASLADFVGEIDAVAHGCGENFPLDDSGQKLDAAPANEKRDPIDRRVELYLFDAEFGITPAPPGKNSGPGSPQYPLWRERVVETFELRPEDEDARGVTFVELADALFRTNSAVVLPEGSGPTGADGQPQGASAISVVGTALRFSQNNPGKRVVVAGHTDTTATEQFNLKLSQERARCVLALLVGGQGQRDEFAAICDARHKVADYKQILRFIAATFSFKCDPGKIDDNAETGKAPVKQFQLAYNDNKSKLGTSAPNLDPDGVVGKLTWGAFFDCYEAALRRELDEDDAGLKALRSQLQFVDDDNKSLGYGEHFPIEELGVDNFRSQTNRRAEILFFDLTEEPDLTADKVDPETSEIYLPGLFVRTSIEAPTARRTLRAFLFDERRQRMPNTRYRLSTGLQLRTNVSDAEGLIVEENILVPRSVLVEWGPPPDVPPVKFEDRQDKAPLEWTRQRPQAAAVPDGFRFRRTLFLELTSDPSAEDTAEAARRLTNLGYEAASFDKNVADFQRDYEVPSPKPWFHAPTRDRLFEVHQDGIPMDLQPTPTPEVEFGLDEDGSPAVLDPTDDEPTTDDLS